MSAEVSYLDTCAVMLFVNKDDELRNNYGIGKKAASVAVCRNHHQLCVAMPALGEVFHMIRQKCGSNYMGPLKELNALLDSRFLETRYITNPGSVYSLAGRLVRETRDSRDSISAMDALVVATAATDPECTRLYTSDVALVSVSSVSDEVEGWREDQGYKKLAIRELSDIFGGN